MTRQNLPVQKTIFKLPNGQYIIPYTDEQGGFEIGDIGHSLYIDETKGLRKRLNGDIIPLNNPNTQDFINFIQSLKSTSPSLFCTDEEYKQIADSNCLGQCGKFVLNKQDVPIYAWDGTDGFTYYTLSLTPKIGDAVGKQLVNSIEWNINRTAWVREDIDITPEPEEPEEGEEPTPVVPVIQNTLYIKEQSTTTKFITATRGLSTTSLDKVLTNQALHKGEDEKWVNIHSSGGLYEESPRVYSGFRTSTDFLTLRGLNDAPDTNLLVPYSTDKELEIILKVRVDNFDSINMIISPHETESFLAGGILLRTIGANNPLLYLWASSATKDYWSINTISTGINLQLGWQYIRIKQYIEPRANDTTQRVIQVFHSTDKENWTEGTKLDTYLSQLVPDAPIYLGADAASSDTNATCFRLNGAIDLNESSIRVGDVINNTSEYIVWEYKNSFSYPDNSTYIKLPKILVSDGPLTYHSLSTLNDRNRILIYSKKTGPENFYQWFNLYSDGWCEQGGNFPSYIAQNAWQDVHVNLLIPYIDNKYHVSMTSSWNSAIHASYHGTKATNSFTCYIVSYEHASYGIGTWKSSGYANINSTEVQNILNDLEITCPYFIQIATGQVTTSTIRNDWQINNPYTLFDAKQSLYPLNNISWLHSLGQWNPKSMYTHAYEALCVELDNTIPTNETVTLPSGGKYTKHLQTVNFDLNNAEKMGLPTVEHTILLDSDTENYICMDIDEESISRANEWEYTCRFQFLGEDRIISSTLASGTPEFNTPYFDIYGEFDRIRVVSSAFDHTIYTELTEPLVINEWYIIKCVYNDAQGYSLYIYKNNGELIASYSNNIVEKINLNTHHFYFRDGYPVDLSNVQFRYKKGSTAYIKTCGTTYREAVWDKAQHSTTEENYKYNFIVDKINETFRLPIYDKLFNNSNAGLYYYVGDTAQNTSLIDVGQLTELFTTTNTKVGELANLTDKISSALSIEPSHATGVDTEGILLWNSTKLGSYTLDLSPYIPFDNHEYDVYLYHYCSCSGDNGAGTNRSAKIYTQDKSQLLDDFTIDRYVTGNGGNVTHSLLIPLSRTSRAVTLELSSTNTKYIFKEFTCRLLWFRKY